MFGWKRTSVMRPRRTPFFNMMGNTKTLQYIHLTVFIAELLFVCTMFGRAWCEKVGSQKPFKTRGMWSVSLHALGSLAREKIKRLVHSNALTFSSRLNEQIKRKNKVRSELWRTNMEAGCWFVDSVLAALFLFYIFYYVCFLIQVKEGKTNISPSVRWQYWIFNGRCECFRCFDLISCLRNEWETDSLSKGGHYRPSYWLIRMKANK